MIQSWLYRLAPGSLPQRGRSWYGPGHVRQGRQRHLDRAAPGDQRFRPDHLLHRVGRAHPGTARGAPAGRGRDGELEPEPPGGDLGQASASLPLVPTRTRPAPGRPAGCPCRRRTSGPRGRRRRAATPGPADALGVDVAVHPVPPGPRPGLVRRVGESGPDRLQFLAHQRSLTARGELRGDRRRSGLGHGRGVGRALTHEQEQQRRPEHHRRETAEDRDQRVVVRAGDALAQVGREGGDRGRGQRVRVGQAYGQPRGQAEPSAAP